MKAEELDKKFDNNEDVLEFFDLSTLKRSLKLVATSRGVLDMIAYD
ncbi:MAG: hypothetical protein QNJ37_22490 [Crocosphaera sp.]|nr:hypothetical protein [Crocosphaera sp.]